MKKDGRKILPSEMPMTDAEFLKSFNENMPPGYPHVSLAIMEKFKKAHLSLFKGGGAWSLDQHRKRMVEWLPQNI